MSSEQANLGLATTRALLIELEARGSTMTPEGRVRGPLGMLANDMLATLSMDVLDYRTVDS